MFQVIPTDFFKKDIKKLFKKYRRIKEDFSPLIDQLEAGELAGDSVPGFNNKLYKTRVPSSDQKKGKSGCFRVLYYLVLKDKEIYLLTAYAKAKKTDIRKQELQKIIDQLF